MQTQQFLLLLGCCWSVGVRGDHQVKGGVGSCIKAGRGLPQTAAKTDESGRKHEGVPCCVSEGQGELCRA